MMFGKNENYVDPSVDRDWSDNGQMPGNVKDFAGVVVGRKIVSAEIATITRNRLCGVERTEEALVLTLDNGARYAISDSYDCCAYTELQSCIFDIDQCDNIITDVATEDGYQKWHVLADFGDVLTLQVEWSCGNPFYYGYGFDIRKIEEVDGSLTVDRS